MKKGRIAEKFSLDKNSLKEYKTLSIGLENCDYFDIDIADVLDISCKAYRYEGSDKYGGNFHTTDGYIRISSRAKDTLCDVAQYIDEDSDEIEDCKLYKRMAKFNDMCVFDLVDKNDKRMTIYVPYGALEDAVYHSAIDYANCPSFEILENGDMEIRFGKLSKNQIVPRNNYPDLVDDWVAVLGDFNPKTLKLKVDKCFTEYEKDETSFVRLSCTILNKERKNKKVEFYFYDFDKMINHMNGKIKNASVVMSRLCNGNIYFGIEDSFCVSCQSCQVDVDEDDEYDDD